MTTILQGDTMTSEEQSFDNSGLPLTKDSLERRRDELHLEMKKTELELQKIKSISSFLNEGYFVVLSAA